MTISYCPSCNRQTCHKRAFGIGTLIAVIVTSGLWLMVMPFYPVRCRICGTIVIAAVGNPDDTPRVTLTVAPTSIAESGGTATVNRVSFGVTTVTVGATAGSNAAAGDFRLSAAKTLTIAAGSTTSTGTGTITAVGNSKDEPNKTVVVTGTATNSQGITQPADVDLTITDDDAAPTVTLAVAPTAIAENGGTATVTATLSHASSAATTVTVTPVAGAYTVGSDATIVIAAESTATATDRVPITAVNDAIDNVGNRRATVAGAAANSQGIGTVTGAALTDDDATPTVTLALSEPDPAKPDTINKSDPDNVSTVTATKGPNTQRDDFTLSNTRTLTIAAGATTSTGTVTVTAADNNDEGDKAVTVTAAVTGNSGVANPTAVTRTIAEAVTRTIGNPDDTPRVTLTVTPTSIAESGGGEATVTATVNRVSFGATMVTVVTVGATAGSNAAAGDFRLSAAKTLTIAAGSTTSTGTVTITAVGNSKDEANKTVVVTGTATNSQGITQPANVDLTITDDDAAPTVTLALSPSAIAESGATNSATATASLDHPSSEATTVTVGATAGTNAASGDFRLSSNATLTIAAGNTSSTGTGTAVNNSRDEVNNSRDEVNKMVVVTGTATNSQGITQPADVDLTITDDDGAPALSIDSPSVTEGDSGSAHLTFTVSLSPVSGRQVTVNYAEGVGGTATSGTDYTALPAGTLTFAAGATSQTITVAVTGDTTDEPDETVKVALSGATHAALAEGGASGTGTITDDDAAPTVTLAVAPSAITESGTGNVSTVTATLDHRSSAAPTVTVAATPGTNAASGDFRLSTAKTLTISAGSTSSMGTATVTAVNNTRDEANKSVTVSGTATNSQGITQPADVDLTITDDDGAPALSIDSPSVTEGDSGSAHLTFTVSLSPVSGRQVTVNYAEGVGGTATSGTDYTALPAGTLTFAAGATSQTITVAVTGDTTDEPDETVIVTLSSPTQAMLAEGARAGQGRSRTTMMRRR